MKGNCINRNIIKEELQTTRDAIKVTSLTVQKQYRLKQESMSMNALLIYLGLLSTYHLVPIEGSSGEV